MVRWSLGTGGLNGEMVNYGTGGLSGEVVTWCRWSEW